MKSATCDAPIVEKKRGRPRAFDRDEAVGRAMLLFWEHGYEATSLNDLTQALGVTPSSIYATFGDKKGLFLAAVERYTSGPVSARSIIEMAPTAAEAAAGLMHSAAHGFTVKGLPRGCLLASAAISCSHTARDVRQTLAQLRQAVEAQLRNKIKADVRAGRLPADTEAAVLATHTMAVIQGMSTLARDGASRASLLRVADAALRCWPTTAP